MGESASTAKDPKAAPPAEKPKAAPAATRERATADAPDEGPQEQVYSREDMVAAARGFLNVSPITAAGALALEPDVEEFTVRDAVELCKRYLKREVEVDQGQPDDDEATV